MMTSFRQFQYGLCINFSTFSYGTLPPKMDPPFHKKKGEQEDKVEEEEAITQT